MIGLISIRAERISMWRQELNQLILINIGNTVAALDKISLSYQHRRFTQAAITSTDEVWKLKHLKNKLFQLRNWVYVILDLFKHWN